MESYPLWIHQTVKNIYQKKDQELFPGIDGGRTDFDILNQTGMLEEEEKVHRPQKKEKGTITNVM